MIRSKEKLSAFRKRNLEFFIQVCRDALKEGGRSAAMKSRLKRYLRLALAALRDKRVLTIQDLLASEDKREGHRPTRDTATGEEITKDRRR